MLVRGAGKICRRKHLPDEKGLRGNGAGQVYCHRAIKCCEYAQPVLLSVVPKECVRAHPWAP